MCKFLCGMDFFSHKFVLVSLSNGQALMAASELVRFKLVLLLLHFSDVAAESENNRTVVHLLRQFCAKCLSLLGAYPMLGSMESVWVACCQAAQFSWDAPPTLHNLPRVSFGGECNPSTEWKPLSALKPYVNDLSLKIALPLLVAVMMELPAFYDRMLADVHGPAAPGRDQSDNDLIDVLLDFKMILHSIAAAIGEEDVLADGMGSTSDLNPDDDNSESQDVSP